MSDDDTVRLRSYSGCDEVNDGGRSFRVNRWGIVTVPASAVPPLLQVGGFHVASPDDVSAIHSTLDDVAEVVWSLPLSVTRSTLLALVTNTNQLNFLAERARSTVRIV
jgi:hypothetical protein